MHAHGATFLSLKTTGTVRERSHALAARLSWMVGALVVVFAVWTVSISGGGPWRAAAAVVPVISIMTAALLLRRGSEGRSFAATAVTIGGVVAALFANLYPVVMVSSTSAGNDLTVSGAASGDYALKVMTVVALVVFPVVLLYQGWSYWVFRHRVTGPPDDAGSAGTTVPEGGDPLPA